MHMRSQGGGELHRDRAYAQSNSKASARRSRHCTIKATVMYKRRRYNCEAAETDPVGTDVRDHADLDLEQGRGWESHISYRTDTGRKAKMKTSPDITR